MPFKYTVGLGNAASYQVSGRPYATGSLSAGPDRPISISFPAVTRWVQVNNSGSQPLRVGFSSLGVSNDGSTTNNFLEVPGNSSIGPIELKVTALHLSGGIANGVSLCAGLTFIQTETIDNAGVSPTSPHVNWTGSVGVG